MGMRAFPLRNSPSRPMSKTVRFPMNNSRENILQKIRQALQQQVPAPFPETPVNPSVMAAPEETDHALEFARHFSSLQGRFSYCADRTELHTQLRLLLEARGWQKIYCREVALTELIGGVVDTGNLHQELGTADCAITGCEYLVARTGSMLLSSGNESGRTTSVYAPVHICIAYTSQLVEDVSDALMQMRNRYGARLPSLISLATGPSRTADIEKTLVVGVHGPKEVFCFLVQD